MASIPFDPADILRIIQAAVAPVVLISGVGLLITILFLGLLLGWNVALGCTLLFVAALLSLVAAMLVFVRELFEALTALDLSVRAPPD